LSTVYVIVAGVTILANFGSAAGDFAKLEFVLNNSAEVGLPPSWLPGLAALKAAGAAGLLLGLLGVPLIGTAAAIGLVAFFIGAVLTHVRARIFYNIGFPVSFLALATATLVLGQLAGVS
jgi:DoxX-like family